MGELALATLPVSSAPSPAKADSKATSMGKDASPVPANAACTGGDLFILLGIIFCKVCLSLHYLMLDAWLCA